MCIQFYYNERKQVADNSEATLEAFEKKDDLALCAILLMKQRLWQVKQLEMQLGCV